MPQVPVHAVPWTAQDAVQSARCVAPVEEQSVIVPSWLHAASVPLHGGKHVEDTVDEGLSRSAQDADRSAVLHVCVTRSGPNCCVHEPMVKGWPHSFTSFGHRVAVSTGTSPVPPSLTPPPPPLEEDEVPDPGSSTQARSETAKARSGARIASDVPRRGENREDIRARRA